MLPHCTIHKGNSSFQGLQSSAHCWLPVSWECCLEGSGIVRQVSRPRHILHFQAPFVLLLFSLRGGTVTAAMLCWVSKDLTRQQSGYQEMRIQSHLHSASSTSQDTRFPLQKRAEPLPRQHWFAVCCSTSMPTEQCQIIQCRGRQHRLLPANIIGRYSKLQSKLLSTDLW